MSEEKKKVIHRLEPKKRPVVLSKASDGEKLAEVSERPMTVNAQFFQDFVDDQITLENNWGVEVEKSSTGRVWLFASIALVGAFFIGCAVWAIFLVNQKIEVVSPTSPGAAEVSFEEKQELRHQAVAQYLGAKTVSERALYVRDAERVLPMMEAYYKKFPLVAETLPENVVESPVMGKENVLWRVRARDKDTYGSLYVLVETDEQGQSHIDWETDVVHQPTDWNSFKSERSSELHTFRALVRIAQLDGFHGFEFAEYNKYRCFRISLPGSEDYLWGYTEVGSKEDVKMVSLITAGGRRNINNKRTVPVMLELRYPDNSQSGRCVHISRLIQAGWLH